MLAAAGRPARAQPQRRALDRQLDHEPVPLDRQLERPGLPSESATASVSERSSAPRAPHAPTRSGRASSSRAITPSVIWMNWSCTVPSAAHSSQAADQPAPVAARCGSSAGLDRPAPTGRRARAGRRPPPERWFRMHRAMQGVSAPRPHRRCISVNGDFTGWSPLVLRPVTKCRSLRANLSGRNDERSQMASSRVDMHCHSTASQLSKLGVQRALGLPECATPPEEVYELAKRARDGLRDDHRSRHDRRRAGDRRPARRVRLRGADGLLHAASRRPCTCSATGITPGRPRVAAGAQRRRRGVRRVPRTSTRSPARSRIRSTPSPRR